MNKEGDTLVQFPRAWEGDFVIPHTMTTIDNKAFAGCVGLKSVVIPPVVTNIDNKAFKGCTNLASISVDESNTVYKSIDGVLYNKQETELIQWPAAKTTITIPAKVQIIIIITCK